MNNRKRNTIEKLFFIFSFLFKEDDRRCRVVALKLNILIVQKNFCLLQFTPSQPALRKKQEEQLSNYLFTFTYTMALIKTIKRIKPVFGENCFLAENATIIGDVKLGDNCSLWFHTVIRGDVNSIRIGNKVNIQDGTVIHCTYQKSKTIIGNNVSVGHNALIHGCIIEDNVLVGMGAIIMDGAQIKSNSIIAAGAVVLENTLVEEGSVYAGVPARKVKNVNKELKEGEIERIANNYLLYSSWYSNQE